ncbi:MAG: hypothetical protein U0935_21830 [Pirellulales bacterium]
MNQSLPQPSFRLTPAALFPSGDELHLTLVLADPEADVLALFRSLDRECLRLGPDGNTTPAPHDAPPGEAGELYLVRYGGVPEGRLLVVRIPPDATQRSSCQEQLARLLRKAPQRVSAVCLLVSLRRSDESLTTAEQVTQGLSLWRNVTAESYRRDVPVALLIDTPIVLDVNRLAAGATDGRGHEDGLGITWRIPDAEVSRSMGVLTAGRQGPPSGSAIQRRTQWLLSQFVPQAIHRLLPIPDTQPHRSAVIQTNRQSLVVLQELREQASALAQALGSSASGENWWPPLGGVFITARTDTPAHPRSLVRGAWTYLGEARSSRQRPLNNLTWLALVGVGLLLVLAVLLPGIVLWDRTWNPFERSLPLEDYQRAFEAALPPEAAFTPEARPKINWHIDPQAEELLLDITSDGKWKISMPPSAERLVRLKTLAVEPQVRKLVFAPPALRSRAATTGPQSSGGTWAGTIQWSSNSTAPLEAPTTAWELPNIARRSEPVQEERPAEIWNADARVWRQNEQQWKKLETFLAENPGDHERVRAELESGANSTTTSGAAPSTDLRDQLMAAGMLLELMEPREIDVWFRATVSDWATPILGLRSSMTVASLPFRIRVTVPPQPTLRIVKRMAVPDFETWTTKARSQVVAPLLKSDTTTMVNLWQGHAQTDHFRLYPLLLAANWRQDGDKQDPRLTEILSAFAQQIRQGPSPEAIALRLKEQTSRYQYSYSYCYFVLCLVELCDLEAQRQRRESGGLELEQALVKALTVAQDDLCSAVEKSGRQGLRRLKDPLAESGDRSVSGEVFYALLKMHDLATQGNLGNEAFKKPLQGGTRLHGALRTLGEYLADKEALQLQTVPVDRSSYRAHVVNYQGAHASRSLLGIHLMARCWLDQQRSGSLPNPQLRDGTAFRQWRSILSADDGALLRSPSLDNWHWYNLLFLARAYQVAIPDRSGTQWQQQQDLRSFEYELRAVLLPFLGTEAGQSRLRGATGEYNVGFYQIATETLLQLPAALRRNPVSPPYRTGPAAP